MTDRGAIGVEVMRRRVRDLGVHDVTRPYERRIGREVHQPAVANGYKGV